jgi:hypothetical protein
MGGLGLESHPPGDQWFIPISGFLYVTDSDPPKVCIYGKASVYTVKRVRIIGCAIAGRKKNAHVF